MNDSALMLFDSKVDVDTRLESALSYIEKLDSKNRSYEEEIYRLNEIITLLKRQSYGKKSERFESQEQMCFNEAETLTESPKLEVEGEAKEIEVKAHKKKARGKRKPLPEHLEREEVVVELPKPERFDEDGNPLKVIGYEVSEKLLHEPATTKVLRIKRAKYGVESGDYAKTAAPLPAVVPKGICTESLLAAIIVDKYAYGLPLYRLEEKFFCDGISIPRSSMARWIIKAAEALMPVRNILSDRLMTQLCVQIDETRTQVLKEKGKTAESTSWMWVMATGIRSHKEQIILFDYNPSRASSVAEGLLADYEGIAQSDGYAGYNFLAKNPKITHIGCNMHARRKFDEAYKASNKGKTLAEEGLKFYQTLYDLESKWRELPHDERKLQREKEASPIWEDFEKWLLENKAKAPPKSRIGIAINYTLIRLDKLKGYLLNGGLEMDTGHVERMIRKFAIGRNNWMFSDTEAGAGASALLYSLLVTIKVNGGSTYQTILEALNLAARAQNVEDYEAIADLIVNPIMPVEK